MSGDPAAGPRPGREVVFDDLVNVRDLGGHPTVDGRRIRDGRWFRGASIHRVAGGDIEILRRLGIRTAIDLRTASEIDKHGGFPEATTGIHVRHLPLIPRNWVRRDDIHDLETATRYLTERFVEMLDTAGPAVAAAVEILANPHETPAIVYCMAGKDRTGVMTALVMALLGVSDEDIARDFHRSHEAAQRVFAWSDTGPNGGSGMVAQTPAVASAPPEAIVAFLIETRRRFGSVPAYVERYGIAGETLSALRANLLIA